MRLEERFELYVGVLLDRKHLMHLKKVEFSNLEEHIKLEVENGDDYEIELGYEYSTSISPEYLTIKYTSFENKTLNQIFELDALLRQFYKDKILSDLNRVIKPRIYLDDILDDLVFNDTDTECYIYTITLGRILDRLYQQAIDYADEVIDKQSHYADEYKNKIDNALKKDNNEDEMIKLKAYYKEYYDRLQTWQNAKKGIEAIYTN